MPLNTRDNIWKRVRHHWKLVSTCIDSLLYLFVIYVCSLGELLFVSLGTRPKQEMFRVWNFAIDHLVQEECFAACAEFNSRNQSINELRYY